MPERIDLKPKYIDVNQVHIPKGFFNNLNVPKLYDWLESQPTANVAEIVMCKDCIHAIEHKYSPAFYKCTGCSFLRGRLVSSTFWCKCGEKGENKMTETEALIKLDEMTFEDEALKFTLREALSTKIPIPVNSKGEEDFGGYSALCPKCDSVIVKIDSLGDICAVCGQVLDWHGAECDEEPKTYYIKCPFEVGKSIYVVIDDGINYPYISTETVTDISTKGVWISTGDSDMENVSHLIEWDEFGIDYFRTYKEAENKIVEMTAGKHFIRKSI